MPEDKPADLIIEHPSGSGDSNSNESGEGMMTPEDYAALKIETLGNIQATNQTGRNVANLAGGVLQAAMARNFDELGTVEGRSVSGVLATPVASPATNG